MTISPSRRALLLATGASLLPGLANAQPAAAWPNRPVRLIVPTAPGGASDRLARLLAHGMGPFLGQTFVVDNRGGAGGTLGTAVAAKSPADGYTLLFTGAFNTINPGLYAKLPYDYLNDFVHVAPMTQGPNVLVVRPDFGTATLAEFVARAKAQPGAIDFASGGNGTSGHLAMEMFQRAAGIRLNHVAYKGAAPALQDVLAGTVRVIALNQDTALPYLKAGKLKALAISSVQRNPALPEVPSFKEAGFPDMVVTSWAGIDAPKGTPAAIVERIAAAVAHATRLPEVRQPLEADGWIPFDGTPAEFDAFVRKDAARWVQVIQSAGIRIDQ
ncbi:Bug family tripartite tricarboxylate transporter substrate binding protein [Variovorax sp. LT1R16]|uniref:Bug family tripartite tricarboxylate transporter substrate binding protein n=1 Tax=Variovorax sp. LT1R16 TaxID=3443728 RepID=UPI003F45D96C